MYFVDGEEAKRAVVAWRGKKNNYCLYYSIPGTCTVFQVLEYLYLVPVPGMW